MVAGLSAGSYSATAAAEQVGLYQGSDGSRIIRLAALSIGVLSQSDGHGGQTDSAVEISLSFQAQQSSTGTAEQLTIEITPSDDPRATQSAAEKQALDTLAARAKKNAAIMATIAKNQIAEAAKAYELLLELAPNRQTAAAAKALEKSVSAATAAYEQATGASTAPAAGNPVPASTAAAADVEALVNQALASASAASAPAATATAALPNAAQSATAEDPVVAFGDALVGALRKYEKTARQIPAPSETASDEAAKSLARIKLAGAISSLALLKVAPSGIKGAREAVQIAQQIAEASKEFSAAEVHEASLYGDPGGDGGGGADAEVALAAAATPGAAGAGDTSQTAAVAAPSDASAADAGFTLASDAQVLVAVDPSLIPAPAPAAAPSAGEDAVSAADATIQAGIPAPPDSTPPPKGDPDKDFFQAADLALQELKKYLKNTLPTLLASPDPTVATEARALKRDFDKSVDATAEAEDAFTTADSTISTVTDDATTEVASEAADFASPGFGAAPAVTLPAAVDLVA